MNEHCFTDEEIEDWYAFEAVRQSGAINMFDAKGGVMLSGLTRDEYLFCMENYCALKKAAENR